MPSSVLVCALLLGLALGEGEVENPPASHQKEWGNPSSSWTLWGPMDLQELRQPLSFLGSLFNGFGGLWSTQVLDPLTSDSEAAGLFKNGAWSAPWGSNGDGEQLVLTENVASWDLPTGGKLVRTEESGPGFERKTLTAPGFSASSFSTIMSSSLLSSSSTQKKEAEKQHQVPEESGPGREAQPGMGKPKALGKLGVLFKGLGPQIVAPQNPDGEVNFVL